MFVLTFVDQNNKKSAYIFRETKEDKQEALKYIIKFMNDIISDYISKGYYKDEDEKFDEKFYNRKIKDNLGLFEDDNLELYLKEKLEKEYFTIEDNFAISLFPLTDRKIGNEETEQNTRPEIEG